MALGALLPEPASGRVPLIERVATWAATRPAAPAFTFVDFSIDPGGVELTLSWSETYDRSRSMAARLRAAAGPGERAALLLPQSLDYMPAMLGCMYARVVAVPLFSPDLPGHAERLIRAYADAEPAVVVTTRGAQPHVEKFLADHDVPRPREIVFADEVERAEWRHERSASTIWPICSTRRARRGRRPGYRSRTATSRPTPRSSGRGGRPSIRIR